MPHMVNRRRVHISTNGHRGQCHFCGAPIKRLGRDRWVRDWRATFHLAPLPEQEKPAPPPSRRSRRSRRGGKG